MSLKAGGVALFAAAVLPLAACATPDWRREAAWIVEAESPDARVRFARDVIDVDTPAGLTLWWRTRLEGPVTIRFEAMAVAEGGPNDKTSDLNAFWMATDRDGSSPLEPGRGGAFADYDSLRTYYAGIGGNRNTTTRFRRYVGEPGNRPLLPQHDRGDASSLLQPGRWTAITLIADGPRVAVMRDGATLFEWRDPAPYTRGHFAFRTTQSHWRLRNVRIEPLESAP